jgi:hypothetical protein
MNAKSISTAGGKPEWYVLGCRNGCVDIVPEMRAAHHWEAINQRVNVHDM